MNAVVKKYLDKNIYMTLSTTCEDGKPWASPLFFANDDEYIYWWSPKDAVHSANIIRGGAAFMTLFDSHAKPACDEATGLYAELWAEEINDKETHNQATTAYNNRLSITKRTPKSFDKFYLDDAPVRIYRGKIVKAWANDVVKQKGYWDYWVDIRREVKI